MANRHPCLPFEQVCKELPGNARKGRCSGPPDAPELPGTAGGRGLMDGVHGILDNHVSTRGFPPFHETIAQLSLSSRGGAIRARKARLPGRGAGKGVFHGMGIACAKARTGPTNTSCGICGFALQWQYSPGTAFAGDAPRQRLKKAFGGSKQGRGIRENHWKYIKLTMFS